jgi:hypothetical protein
VLLAFPRGRSSARLEDGGELHSEERRGSWRLEVRARSRVRWELQASLGTLRRPFSPCSLRLDGRPVPWSYEAATGVLSARFGARHGELVARTCASAHTRARAGG